ncbi:MAG: glycoside hydrolase family 16, partial [Phenylobacterium sp.]|nr:glycoside hydrolase family 16 [Phenylobacterium sp.]
MTAKLTFDDEFNSLNLWNGSSGAWSTTTAFVDPNGNGSSIPGNAEQEWYVNANYAPTASVHPWTVNNGILTLTAQKVDPSIAQYLGYNQAGLPAMGSYQYTSGLIETNHSFTQTYGYFEMSAQLPKGDGLWPAFWLMPANGAWPPELDVMEALGKDTSTAYAAVHTDQTGSHTSVGQAVNVGDFSSGYHTYAVDWEADKITFYYDGKQIMQVATPADMHSPMYMIANLAMGGSWAGSADASTPAVNQMNIDYIRAWDSNPYTNGGTIPSG